MGRAPTFARDWSATWGNYFLHNRFPVRKSPLPPWITSRGSGGFLYNVMYRVDHDAAARIVLVLAITGYLAYAFLLRNILHVGFSRFLMETRTYQKTPMRRLFFLFGKGRVMHSAFTLIARTLQLALCGIGTLLILSLTLFLADWTSSILLLSIGFLLTGVAAWYWVSRHYALYLVPYIVAENPEVTRKEAFQLSADMMQGNRIHALGFDLSYVGLGILSLFTFGLLSVFYITPQRYLGRTEIYMALRQHAIEENLPYSYCLDDEYLEHPPQALLEEEGIQPDENMILYPTAYPQLAPKRHNWLIDHIQDMNPTRHYTLLTLVLFFFIFSIIGWCWEVLVHLVKDGAFIKRGTLMGPWLPIYGTGGLMILIFLRRLANHPALLFFCTMALCSTLEYATKLGHRSHDRTALLGLQQLLHEPQRTYLSGRCPYLRHRRIYLRLYRQPVPRQSAGKNTKNRSLPLRQYFWCCLVWM